MQPFDDHLSAERDPQNEEIIAFLGQVHGISTRAEPQPEQEEDVLGRVRLRLLEVQARQEQEEDAKSRSPLHLLEEPEEGALPSRQQTFPAQKQGWPRRFALLAATLVLTLLVGSLLTLLNLEKHTSFPTPGGQSANSQTDSSQQTLYALSGGWLQKLDTQNGSVLWKSHIQSSENQNGETMFTPASNGEVYMTSGQKLSALSAKDGSQLWSENLDGEVGVQPVVEDNILFVLTWKNAMQYDNHTSLEAFDALSGHQLWHYDQDGLFSSLAVVDHAMYGGINLSPSPTSKNDAYAKFDLFALKATDGSSLWRVHMTDPLLVSTSGAITVTNGTFYVEANTLEETQNSAHGYSHLYAYNDRNGAFLWSTPDTLLLPDSPLVGPQAVFVISGTSLYALHEQNGQPIWRYENKAGGVLNCSLTLQASNIVCLETENSSTDIVELDVNDGQVLTRHLVEHFGMVEIAPTPALPATAPNGPQATATSGINLHTVFLFPVLLVDETASYVVTPEGYLDAFANQTGERLWSTRLIGVPGPVNLMLGAEAS